MKHIKTYEVVGNRSTERPQIYDYVLCEEYYSGDNRLDEFIKNNIGKVVGYGDFDYIYKCKYDNIPYQMNSNYFNNIGIRSIRLQDIKEFSSDKEDLKLILKSKQYNL